MNVFDVRKDVPEPIDTIVFSEKSVRNHSVAHKITQHISGTVSFGFKIVGSVY